MIDEVSKEVYKIVIRTFIIVMWLFNLILMFAYSPIIVLVVNIAEFITVNICWFIACVVMD